MMRQERRMNSALKPRSAHRLLKLEHGVFIFAKGGGWCEHGPALTTMNQHVKWIDR